ncbi:MAG: hypothetical protein NTU62_11720 [Spirochaetes bacterium]|nr:hypothetical protein [Spirochaetota bacterium]
MLSAQKAFEDNILRARIMCGVFEALLNSTTSALDLTDLLRAAVVQSVSAFDYLIHEMVRIGIGQIYLGMRPATPTYLRFEVSFQSMGLVLANPQDYGPIDSEVRMRHSWRAFQRPDKVADAIRIVSEKALWEEVGGCLGMLPADVKTRLSAIVDRRDKIAHEADMDPTDPAGHIRWVMTTQDALDAIKFIDQVGHAILLIVA